MGNFSAPAEGDWDHVAAAPRQRGGLASPSSFIPMPGALAGRLGFSELISPSSPAVHRRHLHVFSSAGKSNFFHDRSGSKSKVPREGNEGFQFLKAHFWKWQGLFSSVLLVGAVANSTPREGEGKERFHLTVGAVPKNLCPFLIYQVYLGQRFLHFSSHQNHLKGSLKHIITGFHIHNF